MLTLTLPRNLPHMLDTLQSEASEAGRGGGGGLRRRRRCPKRAAPGDDPQKTCTDSPGVGYPSRV